MARHDYSNYHSRPGNRNSDRSVRDHSSSVNNPLLLLICAFILLASSAAAQIVDTARISGVVRDSSGARIPSAKISLRSEATGSALSLLSSSEGLYVTPPLSPGDYELQIEASGFSSVIQHVHLELAQRLSTDFTLNLGPTNETVEVKAVAPLLEAESSALSNERTETDVKNLPLN